MAACAKTLGRDSNTCTRGIENCVCRKEEMTEEKAFAEWANKKKRDPECQDSFALMSWKASAERMRDEIGTLRGLVVRQLQWQKHRNSVGIPMSDAERSWIEDAEIAIAPNAELMGRPLADGPA